MTDKERAGEKYQEHINNESCYVSKPEEEIYTDGFLDGLTEGRQLGKEEQWLATEKAQKKTSATIRELKKEIKDLKRQASINLEDYLGERKKLNEIKNYLAYDIPHELMNEATNKIWRMI